MGYETRYELEVQETTILKEVKGVDAEGKAASVFVREYVDQDKLAKEIQDLSGYSYLWGDRCKWYDHERHVAMISKKYPNVVFKLIGEGEESGDMWAKYFKNGMIQVCKAKITYDEFDENKLERVKI
jgi:beta-glucanase (GH16 family)